MRVLITGGAGFIGSHLAERCLDRSDAVVVIDDLSTGCIENIAALKGQPRFEYVIDSLSGESFHSPYALASPVQHHGLPGALLR